MSRKPNIFFTSDTHFNHQNIVLFRKQFATIEEMNELIIQRWNERVSRIDRVYHLGDVALGRPEALTPILKRLNGTIYLIRGNHEATAEHRLCRDQFEWIKDYHSLKVGDQHIYLLHYPMLSWNRIHYGSWHVHGHCHGNLPDDPHARRLDVGVDCWDFRPVAFEEVRAKLEGRGFRPVDHHDVHIESALSQQTKGFD